MMMEEGGSLYMHVSDGGHNLMKLEAYIHGREASHGAEARDDGLLVSREGELFFIHDGGVLVKDENRN